MQFNRPNADVFIPDAIDSEAGLQRTTHLAIVAHQDDTEILAYHGIAECFGQDDKWFSSVIVTDGAGSPRTGVYEKYDAEQMKNVRRLEQRKAASIGEFACQIQLDYPSSSVKDADPQSVKDLLKIFDTAAADVIYLHNPADKHDTHIAVLARALDALRQLPEQKRPKAIYGVEVWRDLDWLPDHLKVVLPTDKYSNLAMALIAVFDSQITGGKRYDLAIEGRRLANATFHQSHSVDQVESLNFAMDLMPLLDDPSLSLADFISMHLDTFKNDVTERIKKYV